MDDIRLRPTGKVKIRLIIAFVKIVSKGHTRLAYPRVNPLVRVQEEAIGLSG